jgi:integrase
MSLWKRGNWYWADFAVEGQRFRVPLETTDWREAKEREQTRIGEAREGKLAPRVPDLARMKLAEAIETYLGGLRGRIQDSSIRSERERLKQVKSFMGDIPLRRISVGLINDYVTRRVDEGKAGRTINMDIGALRRLLKQAKLWRRLSDDVRLLPQRSDVGRALTPEEKERLIKAAAGKRECENARLAMTLSLNTTMRGCEIRWLQWRDVSLIEREVMVPRSKTDAGERCIPLNADAWAVVLELRERVKALLGDDVKPEWYLFPHCEGLRDFDPTMPMKGWRTAWRKLTRAANLSGFRFHDLRHHAITELAEGQASEQTIKSIAGHISKRMLDHYSHIRREAKRRAVEALERRSPVRAKRVGHEVTSQNHVTNPGVGGSRSQ